MDKLDEEVDFNLAIEPSTNPSLSGDIIFPELSFRLFMRHFTKNVLHYTTKKNWKYIS